MILTSPDTYYLVLLKASVWPGTENKIHDQTKLKWLFSVAEIILHKEHAHTLSDKVCLYISMPWVCAGLSLMMACLSEWESFSSWNASKSYPELVIGAGTRSISTLLGYCLKTFFCLCDPYFQQGELLLIYSKRFTFVILKLITDFFILKCP